MLNRRRWGLVISDQSFVIRTPWFAIFLIDQDWEFNIEARTTGWSLGWGRKPDPLVVGDNPYIHFLEKRWNIRTREMIRG